VNGVVTAAIRTDGNRSLRPVTIAALSAGLLMLVCDLSYRALANRLAAPVTTRAIPQETLSGLPLQMGDWVGQDVPLDPAIVIRTDTDARVNRNYSRAGGQESVAFYVAAGVKVRDLAPHRPEVCYTGNGWTLTKRTPLEYPLKDGKTLTCWLFTFSRGSLNAQEIAVLYYYIVDGRYCRDVAELRFNFWRIGYVAQVQVAASVTGSLTADLAAELVSGFAVDSSPMVAGLFEHVGSDPNSSSSQGMQNAE
jgi:hypothetical protein